VPFDVASARLIAFVRCGSLGILQQLGQHATHEVERREGVDRCAGHRGRTGRCVLSDRFEGHNYALSCSNNSFASFRSRVSKPSVNQL
jgi:hypothetical protein